MHRSVEKTNMTYRVKKEKWRQDTSAQRAKWPLLGGQEGFHENGKTDQKDEQGLVWGGNEGRPPRQKHLHIQDREVGRSLLYTRD